MKTGLGSKPNQPVFGSMKIMIGNATTERAMSRIFWLSDEQIRMTRTGPD